MFDLFIFIDFRISLIKVCLNLIELKKNGSLLKKINTV